MKTFVLFQHSVDNKPVVESNSTETVFRTNKYIKDKWAQDYDINCVHDKVLDETFYVVTINGEQFHAPSIEELFSEMREYHDINVVMPFNY